MNGPLSPEELAAQQAYWSTPALSSSAAAPPPPNDAAASYYGPPPPPPAAATPGIDPSWGAPPGAAAALPPVDQVKPGAMFGPPPATGPTNAQPPNPPPAAPPPPKTREPISFESGDGPFIGPPVARYGPTMPAKSHGGGAANADRFGVKKAQDEYLGTFDNQKASIGRQGDAEAAKNVMIADQMQEQSRLKEEDAAIAHAQGEEANTRFESHMAETNRQLDLVRSKKVDPNRYMKDASPIMTILGGVFGGMYQGLNHLDHNPFLDDLNKKIERDIDAQKTDLANEREGVQNRMSMLGQMRAVYKDHALADLQARNLYYESAKENIAAEGARYDTPINKERTQQAIGAIDGQQKQLQLQIKEAAQRAAQQAAAAAAAAAHAARKEAFENTTALIKLGQEDKKLDVEGRKVDAEKGDKLTAQTQALGKELSDEKVVGARKTIDDLKKKMVNDRGEVDGSKRIPGVGNAADTRDELFPNKPSLGAHFVPGYDAANYFGKLDPEERVGRQEWSRLFDAYKVAVTGAGASEGEIENLKKSFGGARTPAEQAAAIRLADEALAERENRIKAGVPREVADYYGKRVDEERDARPKTVPRTPVR